jgi:hypothetical protein
MGRPFPLSFLLDSELTIIPHYPNCKYQVVFFCAYLDFAHTSNNLNLTTFQANYEDIADCPKFILLKLHNMLVQSYKVTLSD